TGEPSTNKPSGPKSIEVRSASAVRAAVSDGSIPSWSAFAVSARYIAPVSRWAIRSARATPRATVLFPAPAGPSIAMTGGRPAAALRGGEAVGIALAYDELIEVLLEAWIRDADRIPAGDRRL